MATAATIDVQLRANTAQYRAAMVDAARVANQNLSMIQREAKRTAESFDQFKRAAVGLISVQAARASTTALLDTVKAQQALVNSMRASIGSAQQAADALSFVSQTSKTLGLDFQSAAEGFQRLTASATANGIAMKDQEQLFLEVSRAATAMQIAPDKVDRAMTALSQSFSKGRFQAEELRQQLAEAIPGVVPRFQKAVMEMTKGTDLAGKSFDQLLQGGLLDLKTFLPAMTQSFAELGTSWRDAAGSLQAESNRVGNAWRQMKLELGDGAFSDTAAAGLRVATVALEGMGTVLPVLVPALTSLAAVKLGERALTWAKGVAASHQAMVDQATAARGLAAEQVKQTGDVARLAAAEAARAKAVGGLILVEREATIAASTHEAAVRRLDAAEKQLAATQSVTRRVGSALLGVFGGPAGLVTMIGLTAAQWLLFRDSTEEAEQALIDWSGTADQAITKFREMNREQKQLSLLQLDDRIGNGLVETRRQIDEMAVAMSNLNVGSKVFDDYSRAANRLWADFQKGRIDADQLSGGMSDLNDRTGRMIGGTADLSKMFDRMEGSLATAAVELDRNRKTSEQLRGEHTAGAAAAQNYAKDMVTLGNAAKEASDRIRGAINTLPGEIERIGKSARQVAQLDVRDWFRELGKDGMDFTNRSNADVQKVIAEGAQYIRLTSERDRAQKAATASARELSRATSDAAQDALRAAEARQKEYKLELAAGDSLNASRRELLKFELELRDTKDKTLKTRAAEIRAVLEQNVAYEDQIDAQRRLLDAKLRAMAVDRQIADYQDSMQQRHQRDLEAIKFGGNTAQWNSILNGINDEFRQQRRGLDQELQNRLASIPLEDMIRRNEEQARYNELIGKTVIAEALATEQAKRNFEELLEAQGDWVNGFQRAKDDYLAAAQDMAGQSYEIFSSAFSGLEDVFTDFLTKGSADWRGFFDDLHAQIMRFIVRQQLSKLMEKFLPGFGQQDQAGALTSAAGALSSSAGPLMAAAAALNASAAALAAAGISNAGTNAASSMSSMGSSSSAGGGWWKTLSSMFSAFSSSGYDTGGYTGPGGRLQPAGVVHKGEVVWSQGDVARAGGVAAVEAMRRGLRGYADGGFVGGSERIKVPKWGDSSRMAYPGERDVGRRHPSINITIPVEGQVSRETKAQIASQTGREIRRQLARNT